jgi:hypothetical protein
MICFSSSVIECSVILLKRFNFKSTRSLGSLLSKAQKLSMIFIICIETRALHPCNRNRIKSARSSLIPFYMTRGINDNKEFPLHGKCRALCAQYAPSPSNVVPFAHRMRGSASAISANTLSCSRFRHLCNSFDFLHKLLSTTFRCRYGLRCFVYSFSRIMWVASFYPQGGSSEGCRSKIFLHITASGISSFRAPS